ncbi:MAG: molybdopterin-synthase adenylyltransferase MoeB [Bacteroidetes bacterium]|nr:molybdopterin-synthase adenylyltransferase MoeB [Bacteroidota bacterium]
MFSEAEKKQYARHLILPEIGEGGQRKLKQTKIVVIGAGGLGCPILQYLAAAGVGMLGVVDFDVIEQSNLQRQILFSVDDVGKYKADVAKEKIQKLNPYIQVHSYVLSLSPANAIDIISHYDLVIDGSDNFATRYLVNDACVMLNKPFVFGSIFKFEGQLSVFHYKEGPTYRCLYPEPPAAGEMPSCAEAGVLGALAGLCGLLMANEALKISAQIGEVLSGKLLVFNVLTMQFHSFEISPSPSRKKIQQLSDYTVFCETIQEMTATRLKQKIKNKEPFQLIDVREEHEYRTKNIGGLLIPLGVLQKQAPNLNKNIETIVHCASGARGKKAAAILLKLGFKNVSNLKNGLLDF